METAVTRRGAISELPLKRLLVPSLIPIASFAVHQLRYLAAFGSNAPGELAGQGHGYFSGFTPLLVVTLGFALGIALMQMAGAWRTGESDESRRRSLLLVWLAAAAGFLAIYGAQELLEGFFATGHPTGLNGVFGNGGLWAVPASIVIGLLLTLAVRAMRGFVALIARLSPRTRPLVSPSTCISWVRRREPTLRLAPIAARAAGRAPPLPIG